MRRSDGPERRDRGCGRLASVTPAMAAAASAAILAGPPPWRRRQRATIFTANISPAGMPRKRATSARRRSGTSRRSPPIPKSSELISRSFLMEVCVGHFDRGARAGATRAETRSERCGGRTRPGDRCLQAGNDCGRRRKRPRRCPPTGCTASSRRSRWPGRGWRPATSPAPTPRCRASTSSTAFSR